MKYAAVLFQFLLGTWAVSLRGDQDPCSGCTIGLSLSYQKGARDHGDPCAERNSAGLVSDAPGQKKDVSCCVRKQKHDRCMKCITMDCQYKTCNVNKKYYSEYEHVERAKQWTVAAYEKHDDEAM